MQEGNVDLCANTSQPLFWATPFTSIFSEWWFAGYVPPPLSNTETILVKQVDSHLGGKSCVSQYFWASLSGNSSSTYLLALELVVDRNSLHRDRAGVTSRFPGFISPNFCRKHILHYELISLTAGWPANRLPEIRSLAPRFVARLAIHCTTRHSTPRMTLSLLMPHASSQPTLMVHTRLLVLINVEVVTSCGNSLQQIGAERRTGGAQLGEI